MYEVAFTTKYLSPRWRQLSVSIISLISILVISAVVWLIVVFFSVANGLTGSWIDKLIALTAPVRITPTEHYYNSYYYLVDGFSSESGYALKTISEKRAASQSDPYDPMVDEELPSEWLLADRYPDETLRDPVKEAYAAIASMKDVKGLKAVDFEMAVANLQLPVPGGPNQPPKVLSQPSFLGSFDPFNRALLQSLLPLNDSALDTVRAKLPLESDASFWQAIRRLYNSSHDNGEIALELPSSVQYGDAVLLPRGFKEAGAAVGDRGYLVYQTVTATSVQEQHLPIIVAGFYDPGIIPMGGKYIVASQPLISLIRAAYASQDQGLSNGINLRFADREQADYVKESLQKAFDRSGIAPYWKIETYRDYEFTRDIIQQLQSEKHMFTLLATIIIIVACSNIISMLIILVNDKKLEIGILRAMGASSTSIAAIFGLCGLVMGIIGSLIGIAAALVTLKNIQAIVDFIGRMQGYEMFNPLFYGNSLPNEVSAEALTFVILATGLISLMAGMVPAIKASLLKPSAILKTE